MYAVSDRFLDAIRSPHTTRVKATHTNLVTSVATTLSVVDGSITDDKTSNVRRTLSLSLPNDQATWDALDTVGGEITVQQGIRFVDGDTEWVPMGVFIVDVDEIGYAPGDALSMGSAPDRWGKVQKNKLPPTGRSSIPTNTAWQEIKRLVEGAWSADYPFPGWASLDESATTKVGSIAWDDDREAAILGLCKDNAVEVFFDRNGLGVLRPVPLFTDTSPSVWTVDAGARGVLIGADRSRDRTKLANVIEVTTSATDVVFAPVVVANTTVGDPLSIRGPLGYQSEPYDSAGLRNSAQARAAGLAQLNRTLGVAKQLSLEAVGNFALDSDDVVLARLPRIDRNIERPVELHIVDTVSHPLAPTGTQTIATRSTRPDTDAA